MNKQCGFCGKPHIKGKTKMVEGPKHLICFDCVERIKKQMEDALFKPDDNMRVD